MTDIGFVNGLMEQIDNCRTEESIMPMSCKCILDRMVFKGAMTEKERDKIQRNLHERKTGKWIFGETLGHSWMKCSECCKSQDGQTLCFTYCPNCGAKMEAEK